jgi:hypothetical protein
MNQEHQPAKQDPQGYGTFTGLRAMDASIARAAQKIQLSMDEDSLQEAAIVTKDWPMPSTHPQPVPKLTPLQEIVRKVLKGLSL